MHQSISSFYLRRLDLVHGRLLYRSYSPDGQFDCPEFASCVPSRERYWCCRKSHSGVKEHAVKLQLLAKWHFALDCPDGLWDPLFFSSLRLNAYISQRLGLLNRGTTSFLIFHLVIDCLQAGPIPLEYVIRLLPSFAWNRGCSLGTCHGRMLGVLQTSRSTCNLSVNKPNATLSSMGDVPGSISFQLLHSPASWRTSPSPCATRTATPT